MSNRLEFSRRSFLKVVSVAGTGLVLGSFGLAALDLTDTKKKAKKLFIPNAFVAVDGDNLVTITVSRPDMGQGSRTALAMLVAEEMDADWTKVRVVQAPTDSKLYGYQGTGGSNTIRSSSKQLRQLGAATRHLLIAAAAAKWGVPPETLQTSNGTVIDPVNHRTLPYGDLTEAAAALPAPTQEIALKKPSEFKLLGKGATRVDNLAVATGKANYGIDAKTEGMVYAVVARPASFGGKLLGYDEAAAKKVAGVLDVQKFRDGVAVIGTNTWSAIAGREALKTTWDAGPNGEVNSTSIRESLKATATPHPDAPAGSKVLEAEFDLPFLAHATMEPMNALADVKPDRCTVWVGTQQPDAARGMIAKKLNLPLENVTVNVALLGGGFGRRLIPDFIDEAVDLSKQFGKPVKLTWTREDDMKHDHYRGMSYHTLRGAVDGSGEVVLLSHQALQAGQGRVGRFGCNYRVGGGTFAHGGQSGIVPTGPWRSVENTLLNVVNECFIDELAHLAGADPYKFRSERIADGRLKAVLDKAAELANWSSPLPTGHGRGIACFNGYGSRAAHVVELSVAGNKVKLHRVVAVVDCGFAVNPKGVEAQMQGACTDGLSTALRAAITIEKGGVAQNSWNDYQWMTLDAMPKVEVHQIQGADEVGGMGEVGYPSVAPAVANAIFAATGKRVRKFPIRVEDLV